MKKILKNFSALVLVCLIALSVFAIPVFAAGSSSISFSKSTMNVGDTFTATVKFNASDIGYLESTITYDSKIVQLVESDTVYNGSSGVTLFNITSSKSVSTLSAKFTFKAIAVGSANISVANNATSYDTFNTEQSGNTITGCSAKIQVKDPSVAKSSNANLTYLRPSAGALSPNFSKNTTSYSVTIPYSATELLVYAGTEDEEASITVEGSKDMKVGTNKRVLKVTAADGTVKIYTLNITRLEADGTASNNETSSGTASGEEPTDTAKVFVDGEEKYIAENFSSDIIYKDFALTTHKYNDVEYPAITDGGTTLLYLVDEKGENGEFYRIDKENHITKFSFITIGDNMFQILTPEEGDLEGDFTTTLLTVGNEQYEAYDIAGAEDDDFVFFWAKCSDNTGLYRYDIAEKTMQRAEGLILLPEEEKPADSEVNAGNILDNIMNLGTNGKIVAITIVAILLLLVAAIIIIIVKLASSGRKDDYDYDFDSDDDDEQEENLFKFDNINIDDRDNN